MILCSLFVLVFTIIISIKAENKVVKYIPTIFYLGLILYFGYLRSIPDQGMGILFVDLFFSISVIGMTINAVIASSSLIYSRKKKRIKEEIEKKIVIENIQIAQDMLAKNKSLDFIAEVTGFSIEEIKTIQSNLPPVT